VRNQQRYDNGDIAYLFKEFTGGLQLIPDLILDVFGAPMFGKTRRV